MAPELAIARVARGLALGLSERYEEAADAFELGRQLNPRSVEVYRYWAQIEIQRGNLERAAELLEQEVELTPDDYRAWQLLPQVYRGLGRSEEEKKAHQELLEVVHRDRMLDPEDLGAHYAEAGA